MLRPLCIVSTWLMLWTLPISSFGQDYQTVIFEPRDEICVDEPPFELQAESFDFEGGGLRAMSLNIHTGIGGYSATTSGGISTQYTEPAIWPLIIEEIGDRIFEQDLDIFGLQEVIGGTKTVNDGQMNKTDSEQSEIIKQVLNSREGADLWDYRFSVVGGGNLLSYALVISRRRCPLPHKQRKRYQGDDQDHPD